MKTGLKWSGDGNMQSGRVCATDPSHSVKMLPPHIRIIMFYLKWERGIGLATCDGMSHVSSHHGGRRWHGRGDGRDKGWGPRLAPPGCPGCKEKHGQCRLPGEISPHGGAGGSTAPEMGWLWGLTGSAFAGLGLGVSWEFFLDMDVVSLGKSQPTLPFEKKLVRAAVFSLLKPHGHGYGFFESGLKEKEKKA